MNAINNVKKIFPPNKLRSWIVGSGVSLTAPSNLPTGYMFLKSLIEFSTPAEYHERLLGLADPNRLGKKSSGDFLRFEQVVERIQYNIDPSLKILDFIGETNSPNLNHHFLAATTIHGDQIFTTNFDHLIERSLLDQIDTPGKIFPVITQEEFEQQIPKEKIPIYKLHGSIYNIINEQETRDTLGVTLERIGRGAEDAFSLEEWKQRPLEQAAKGSDLIVIGYSGSDSFDVMPTLKKLPHIKGVIRIIHETNRKVEYAEIIQGKMPLVGEFEDPFNELECAVTNIIVDTGLLLSYLAKEIYGIKLPSTPVDQSYNGLNLISKWSNELYIDEGIKFLIAGFIFNEKDYNEIAIESFRKSVNFYKSLDKKNEEMRALTNLAVCLSSQSRFEEALDYNKIILEHSRSTNNIKREAITLTNMGNIYARTGRVNDTVECLEKALEIHDKLNDLNGKQIVLNNLGNAYLSKGRIDQAIEYLKQSLDLAKSFGDRQAQANLMDNIASAYIKLGRKQEAIELYNDAIKLCRLLGDKDGLAIRIGNLSILHFRMRNYKDGNKLIGEALVLLKELGKDNIYARFLVNKGEALNNLGKSDEAINAVEEAINIQDKIGDYFGIAKALEILGNIHSKQDPKIGIGYYKKAINIFNQLDAQVNIASIFDNIAYYSNKFDDLEEARANQEKAIDIYRQLNMKYDLARSLGILGEILNRLELRELSIKAHQESLEIYKEMNKQDKVAIQLANLSISYFYMKKLEEALQKIDEAIQIVSQLNNETLLEQIKGIRKRYE
jgi:tetratricopeptide (TPR) repeat protein